VKKGDGREWLFLLSGGEIGGKESREGWGGKGKFREIGRQ